MEEKKLFELRIELKDISGASNPLAACTVEISDQKETVQPKCHVVLSLSDLAANTSLSLSVKSPEKTLGSTKISIGTLFGDSLQGKVDRWFKLKSDELDNLKIKILASLSKLDKIKPKASVPTRRSSKGIKEVKCPYLDKLATGKETNAEPLNDIWKYRDSNQVNLIKISVEPDSPGRESDIVELGLTHIEDVAIEVLHSMEGPHLKQVVKRLCDQAKKLGLIASKLPDIRSEMYQKINQRRSVEVALQQEMESLKENWTKKHEILLELQEGRKSAKEALIEKQDQARKLESELDMLKAQLGDYKRENIVLNTQRLQYEDCRRVLADLEKLNQESIKKKAELQEKIDKSQYDLSDGHSKGAKDIEQIKKDRDNARKESEDVSKELKSTTESNEKLRKSIQAIKSRLSDLQDLKSQARHTTVAYQAESAKRDEISLKLDQLTTELEKQSADLLTKQQDLISSKRASAARSAQSDQLTETREQEILETRIKLLDASSKKIAQEQICCVRADLDQLMSDFSKLKRMHEDSRSLMLRDMEAGSRILVEESNKVYAQAERLDYMIDAVDKKGEEIDGLKTSMGVAKKTNLTYVALRDDPVDVALADYLASKAEPVPIKFVRQGNGNYLFGTKKIYIKLEVNRLLVRVGGGFTSIDEFLTIYTPVELEKKDSPDASPRFSSISKSSRDSSPSSLVGRLSLSEDVKSPRR